jgi:hypothetical protein
MSKNTFLKKFTLIQILKLIWASILWISTISAFIYLFSRSNCYLTGLVGNVQCYGVNYDELALLFPLTITLITYLFDYFSYLPLKVSKTRGTYKTIKNMILSLYIMSLFTFILFVSGVSIIGASTFGIFVVLGLCGFIVLVYFIIESIIALNMMLKNKLFSYLDIFKLLSVLIIFLILTISYLSYTTILSTVIINLGFLLWFISFFTSDLQELN